MEGDGERERVNKVRRNKKLEENICYISLICKEHLQIFRKKMNNPVGKNLMHIGNLPEKKYKWQTAL